MMSTSGSAASSCHEPWTRGMPNVVAKVCAASAERDPTATTSASGTWRISATNWRAMPPVASTPHRIRSLTSIDDPHLRDVHENVCLHHGASLAPMPDYEQPPA